MALTKISRGLLSTGISDSSDSTAITIDGSENVAIGASSTSTKVTIQAADSDTVNSSANGHLTFYDDAPFGYYKIRIATTNRDLAFDGYDTDNSWKEILKLDRVDQRINAKGGIMFGSDTATANTLDDYEEGTWTPASSSNGTVSNAEGFYVKIGKMVHVLFYFSLSGASTSSSVDVTGLPYAVQNNIGPSNVGGTQAIFGDLANYLAFAQEASSLLTIEYDRPLSGTSATSANLRGSVTYMTAL